MKKILVILDGGGDLPLGVFGGKTPLEIADTPNMDFFAREGKLGFMHPIKKGVVPGSDNALISFFGNDPKDCKRGVYEAIGAGFDLKRGDLAIRTNLGTIDNLKNKIVVDRRAGRTITTAESEKLAETLNKKIKLDKEFEYRPTVQHRGVLVIRGGLSDNISNVDNEWNISGKRDSKFHYSRPLDDSDNAKYSANLVNSFIDQAFGILNNHSVNLERVRRGLYPGNMIFMRGAGSEIPRIKQYRSWMSTSSMPLEIGISKASGMKNFSFEMPRIKSIDFYKYLHKTLNKKIKHSIKTIKRNHKDFLGCYVHFKETDQPGHDNKPYEKKNMFEMIDKKFFGFLRKFVVKNPLMVVVTCDHSTPCKLKGHSADPVPVLVYGNGKDETTKFSEKQSRIGNLGEFYGRDLMRVTGLNK